MRACQVLQQLGQLGSKKTAVTLFNEHMISRLALKLSQQLATVSTLDRDPPTGFAHPQESIAKIGFEFLPNPNNGAIGRTSKHSKLIDCPHQSLALRRQRRLLEKIIQ